jgi:hypothetical protein
MAVVRSRVVASLSVEHRRLGDWATVGKLVVLARLSRACQCGQRTWALPFCLLLDRCRVACPHTASAAMRLAAPRRRQRRRSGRCGLDSQGSPAVCKARLSRVGSSAAGGLASVVSVSELVSGSPRRVGIANPLDPPEFSAYCWNQSPYWRMALRGVHAHAVDCGRFTHSWRGYACS